MKRDIRLQGLSSDHQHALVLARTIRLAFDDGSADSGLVDDAHARYEQELKPHFATEEDVLLPALAKVGQEGLARRTREEHAELRRLLGVAHMGELDALRAFGVLLESHVRFEESELFPTCERQLDDDVLDAVAARAPKHRTH